MDTVTHMVAGALTPLAFIRAPRTRLMIVFGIVCGEFPDIDVIAGRTPEMVLSFHRGITHSVFLQPLFALVLALIFHRFLIRRDTGGWTLANTWCVALAAMLGHLFLDCMTMYGTQIFQPFADYRVAFPAVYVVDLLLTLPLLAAWALVIRRMGRGDGPGGVRLAKAGLAWMICYPMAALIFNQAVTANLDKTYAGNQDGIIRLDLVPEPFSPLNWKVVAETRTSFLTAPYRIVHPRKPLEFTAHDKAGQKFGQWDELTKEIELYRLYARFARYPICVGPPTVLAQGGAIHSVGDALYETTMPGLMRLAGRSDRLFLIQSKYENGRLAYRFLHREREAGRTPWTEAPDTKRAVDGSQPHDGEHGIPLPS